METICLQQRCPLCRCLLFAAPKLLGISADATVPNLAEIVVGATEIKAICVCHSAQSALELERVTRLKERPVVTCTVCRGNTSVLVRVVKDGGGSKGRKSEMDIPAVQEMDEVEGGDEEGGRQVQHVQIDTGKTWREGVIRWYPRQDVFLVPSDQALPIMPCSVKCLPVVFLVSSDQALPIMPCSVKMFTCQRFPLFSAMGFKLRHLMLLGTVNAHLAYCREDSYPRFCFVSGFVREQGLSTL